jgi:hypothetical protein
MKKLVVIAIVAGIFTSCEEFKKGFEDGKRDAQEKREAVSQETPEVTLYKFSGGTVQANNLNLFAQGDTYKGESKQLADAFYVIKHPDGVLLWDTGLPEMLVGQEPYTPEGGAFTISRKDQLTNIEKLDGDKDVFGDGTVIIKSMPGHTGAANHFPKAKWFVQSTEYDFANSEEIKGNSFYAPASFNQLTNIEKLDGDKDVFGDGTVIIKSMPGHTGAANHFPKAKWFVQSTEYDCDIYHFEKNRQNAVVPQFNYDIPTTEKSIKEFEAFAKAQNATVIIQHDAEDFAKTPAILN